jgi:alkylhydroperoxidase/carboxymuconolactone decarboxylase family protein YurZ
MTDSAESPGDAIKRRLLGPDFYRPPGPPATQAEAAYAEMTSRELWEGVWSRPGLDLAMRRAITMAVLIGLGQPEGLATHARGALADGMTAEEIGEIVLHCALYCGAPAGGKAFSAVRPLLTDTNARGDVADTDGS